MIGKKVELHQKYLQDYLGCSYKESEEKVFAIILDKVSGINKYDTYEGASHSTNYIYLTTDYYLIQLLEGNNEKVNSDLKWLGNIRHIKPHLIKSVI